MSRTYYFRRELVERENERALDMIIEESYELALKNQRIREAILWERRAKSGPITPSQ